MADIHTCAKRIREYWAAKGYRVRVEVIREVSECHSFGSRWIIKSDLKNGLPHDADAEIVRQIAREVSLNDPGT